MAKMRRKALRFSALRHPAEHEKAILGWEFVLMALYPLRVPHLRYRGRARGIDRMRKAAELHQAGERIVAHINGEMEQCAAGQSCMFPYAGVAHTLKVELKDVEAVLQELGGGGSGITVVKRDP
jgi:hypothetical protein